MESRKGIGQKYRKVGTKDYFIFASWFYSNKSEEAAMEVRSEFIGTAKKTTKGLCKDTIEKLTKDGPGGSYLVLSSKPMVPGGRPIIAIGYKYNARKVLYFIVIENAEITRAGLPYLSKDIEQFINVLACC